MFSGCYQVDEIPNYKWQAVNHVVYVAACISHLHPVVVPLIQHTVLMRL
jgi:hypothetical protein